MGDLEEGGALSDFCNNVEVDAEEVDEKMEKDSSDDEVDLVEGGEGCKKNLDKDGVDGSNREAAVERHGDEVVEEEDDFHAAHKECHQSHVTLGRHHKVEKAKEAKDEREDQIGRCFEALVEFGAGREEEEDGDEEKDGKTDEEEFPVVLEEGLTCHIDGPSNA